MIFLIIRNKINKNNIVLNIPIMYAVEFLIINL